MNRNPWIHQTLGAVMSRCIVKLIGDNDNCDYYAIELVVNLPLGHIREQVHEDLVNMKILRSDT